MKMTPAPRMEPMEQITAKVAREPYSSPKVTSVTMTNADYREFDAKAFSSTPTVMKDLARLSPGSLVTLYGNFRENRLKPQYKMFVVNEVAESHDTISSFLTQGSSSPSPSADDHICPSCNGTGYLRYLPGNSDDPDF